MRTRRSIPLFVACLVVLTVVSVSIAVNGRTIWSAHHPDIILITVDSLRADALGVYGYQKATSPNLDRFAREAVVITDAIAQAPFTKPSIASLMTGLFPGSHKTYSSSKPAASILKRHGRVSGQFEVTDALPRELPTLAQSLAAIGYRTIGLSANPFLIQDFGYGKGFDEFRFLDNGEAYARAPGMLREALRALTASRGRPVFLWVHLMDTHNPYTPSQPYRSMFRPESPERLIEQRAIDEAARIEGSRDVNLYRARYDACVRETDAGLGAFFDKLRAIGVWDGAAVIVTADHGEAFFEHSRMGHNTDLFDEQLHIPLLMKLPGVRPGRAPMTAQLLDLYPTLLHLAGHATVRSHGTDLLPALAGQSAPERYAFAELPGKLWAARTREWKLISGMPGTGKLFNLSADPRETRNVIATAQREATRLDRVLAAMISTEVNDGRKVARRQVPMDPRIVDQLRTLGYLNGPR